MPENPARLAALIAELEHRITGLIAPEPAGTPAQIMAMLLYGSCETCGPRSAGNQADSIASRRGATAG